MGRDLETTPADPTSKENGSQLFLNPDEIVKNLFKGTPLEDTHRVQILVDGKEIMGVTTTHNPQNSEELTQMLKDFVDVMEAPKTPVKEGF